MNAEIGASEELMALMFEAMDHTGGTVSDFTPDLGAGGHAPICDDS